MTIYDIDDIRDMLAARLAADVNDWAGEGQIKPFTPDDFTPRQIRSYGELLRARSQVGEPLFGRGRNVHETLGIMAARQARILDFDGRIQVMLGAHVVRRKCKIS